MFSGLMPTVSTALACLTARAAETRRSTPPRLASVGSCLILTPSSPLAEQEPGQDARAEYGDPGGGLASHREHGPASGSRSNPPSVRGWLECCLLSFEDAPHRSAARASEPGLARQGSMALIAPSSGWTELAASGRAVEGPPYPPRLFSTSTSPMSVRWTGHMSAISSSRRRCFSSRAPSSSTSRPMRSILPSSVSHSSQSLA